MGLTWFKVVRPSPFAPLEVTPMADIAPVTTAPLPVVALPDEIDMVHPRARPDLTTTGQALIGTARTA